MRLERITLEKFRSFTKATYHFGQITLVIAPNGSGKTNMLEAIHLLATGVSERADKIEEMVAWESELSSVAGVVENQGERVELSVVLTRGTYMGRRTPKRRLLVDGVPRLRSTFLGNLITTLFRPEDMRLLEGSPSRRRSYLDCAIEVVMPEYQRALSTYMATLSRRNRLLDAIREGRARRSELSYWDQSLVKNGDLISGYRSRYIDYLNDHVRVPFGTYEISYKSSQASLERLQKYQDAEIAVGHTLVGPHKDDFIVESEGVNLLTYGSRGEQRLGVLFLKIGAMNYVETKRGVSPILLLDDIFSELDEAHRREVVALMHGRQVVVTSAEEESLAHIPDSTIIRL
jgi:DNA replication and repair protein RecF